eukprot:2367706-Rhodomonas_salina.1
MTGKTVPVGIHRTRFSFKEALQMSRGLYWAANYYQTPRQELESARGPGLPVSRPARLPASLGRSSDRASDWPATGP